LPKLPRQGTFAEVSKLHPDAAIALGLLHRAGNLIWHTPFTYEIINLPKNQQKLKQLMGDQMGDQNAIAKMQAFIRTNGDRWAFLLDAFDCPK